MLSLVPVFVFTTKTSSIVGGATAAMYVAYFLIMSVTLIYRFRGWPKVKGRFSLGRWGIPVNIVAVLGTGLTALDLLWPQGGHQPDLQPDLRHRRRLLPQGHPDGLADHRPFRSWSG